MTGPQNATEVAAQLAKIARQLDAVVSSLAELDEQAVRARMRHEVEFARAFLAAEGAVDVRKQTAVLAAADRKLDAELLEAQVRAAKESIRTLHARIDVGRSLGAAVRAEIALAGAA